MIHRKRGQKNTARLVASGILLCIRIRRHSFFTALCGGHSSSRSICVGGHRWFVGYTLFFFQHPLSEGVGTVRTVFLLSHNNINPALCSPLPLVLTSPCFFKKNSLDTFLFYFGLM